MQTKETQMSIEDVQRVVEMLTIPILEAVNAQSRNFQEFKKEVQDAQKIMNESIASQMVDRKDLENHKKSNEEQFAKFDISLSKNWEETRAKANSSDVKSSCAEIKLSLEKHDSRLDKLERNGSKWAGIIAAWGGFAGVVAFIFMIYKAFK